MRAFEGEADAYLLQVRAAAARIVQEANAEAATIRQRSEQAGREAAEQAIQELLDEKVGAKVRTLRPAVEKVAQQLSDSRGEWLDHWHRTGVAVAKQMAARILRRELRDDPQVPLQFVRETLDLATGAPELTIRLSKHDFADIEANVKQLAEALGSIAQIHVLADESISPGGCVATTKFGEIDQQIETQLNRLEEELTA